MASKAEWTVRFKAAALKDFEKLDRGIQQSVYKHLQKIQQDPLQRGAYLRTPLAGFKKDYVLNKKYRIVFEVDAKKRLVWIWAIGRRDKSKVYQVMTKRLAKLLPR